MQLFTSQRSCLHSTRLLSECSSTVSTFTTAAQFEIKLALGAHPVAVAAPVVPGHVNPSIVQLTSHSALTRGASRPILIPPFPVEAPGHPGAHHHMLHHVRPQQPSRLPQSCLCLFSSLAQFLTDPSGCAIDLKAREREVVSLCAGIPSILLDPHMPNSTCQSSSSSTFNLPGGSAARLAKLLVAPVLAQHHPVHPVLAPLQLPAAQCASSVATSVPQGVGSRLQPYSKVYSEPGASVVVCVAVQCVGVPAEDVFKLSIGKASTFAACDDNKSIGGWINPVLSCPSIRPDPVKKTVCVKV